MSDSSPARRSELMGTQSIGKLLWRFSLPGVIAMLVNATYNIVDTIFVGGLGPEAIAALTVVFPIQMIIIAIGAGTGIGAASLVSRRLGEGRFDEANRVVGQTHVISLIIGIVITALGLSFGYPLLRIIGASDQIINNSFAYMSIIVAGAIFNFTNMTGNNLVRAGGHPIVPMVSMITGAGINTVLDPIFIYALKLGVRGAAIATVLAQAVVTGILFYYLFGNKTDFRVRLHHYVPRLNIWGQIYAVGGPHMLMSLVGSVTMAVVNNVASAFGPLVIAAYGVLFRVMQFGFMPCIGISQGALPIIGYNFGAKKYLRVRGTILRTILISTAITSGVAILAIAFPRQVVSIFNRNPEFLPLAAHAMRIAFIGFALVGTQVAFASFFQGIGKGIPSAVIGISRQLLILVPAILLFARLFGQEGIWFAIPLADVTAFIIAVTWTSIAMRKLGIGLWGGMPSI
jgi:putative MATE family efflux protein